MHTVTANSLQHSVYELAKLLEKEGSPVTVRGYETLELHPCVIEVTDPRARTLLYPKRGNNPFATLAETIWVLAGRNDVEFLSFFLPRAGEFSDDGKVWRAAYGDRLFHWPAPNEKEKTVDQIHRIIDVLLKDLASRQAVATIWDPARDATISSSKDFPCSNYLHFMVRNNKLDLLVVIRSNDFLFGFSAINEYEFTVLQEIVAACLGIELGSYYQLSDSMHVYKEFSGCEGIKKLDQLIANYPGECYIPPFEFDKRIVSYEMFRKDISSLILNLDSKINPINGISTFQHSFTEIETILSFYINSKKKFTPEEASEVWWNGTIQQIGFNDLTVACSYWIHKNIEKKKDCGKETIRELIARIEKENK
jgi:thymidylate synthase